MPCGLTLLPTNCSSVDINNLLENIVRDFKNLKKTDAGLLNIVCSRNSAKSDLLLIKSKLDFNEHDQFYIHNLNLYPSYVAGVFKSYYKIGERPENPSDLWCLEETSVFLQNQRDEYIKANAQIGYYLVFDVYSSIDDKEDTTGKKKYITGLIIAMEIAKSFGAVLLMDEAWTEPLSGAYHWSEVYNFIKDNIYDLSKTFD